MYENIKKILPGLLISIVVMLISKLVANYIPLLGAASIAIFLGIFLGNTILKSTVFEKGTKFSEGRLLEISIVLLGCTITISTLTKLGVQGILFIVLQMFITIVSAVYIGKKLAFNKKMSFLVAGGNGVCGSSAIAAISPVIKAKNEDKALAITLVNIMGTVLMLLLPIISYLLYQHQTLKSGALIGGILQSVGQVVASGSLVSEEVSNMAAIFKVVRIIFLVVVVISMGRLVSDNENEKKISINKLIPWYIIGFFVMCFLNSFNIIAINLTNILKDVSGYFEIIALAAIGLRLDFSKILASGRKLLLYGILVGLVQILSAVMLIMILL